jgi:hypothetical protein
MSQYFPIVNRAGSEMNGGGMTPERLLSEIPDAPKLRKDIELAGDLRERVILRPLPTGKFKSVEGNRRRYAFGELHKKYPEETRWQSMPARILPENIDERKVALLLSDMHVVGKVKWDAAEKAGQIFKMNRELDIPLDEIIIHLHASKATVIRWLKAYAFLHERYRKIDNGKYDKNAIEKWSWIDEAYRSPVLRGNLEDDPGFGDRFCRWVGDGRLPKGEYVRRLASILNNPTAAQAFDALAPEKAYTEAMRIVSATEPEQDSDLYKLLAKVRELCSQAGSIGEVTRLREDTVKQQRFRETVKAMRGFAGLADVDIVEK